MDFKRALARSFPGASTEAEFIKSTHAALARLGFRKDNTIAFACVCRDEITQPLVQRIQNVWGEAFNLSSLAGMFFAGETALRAGMHHAPNQEARERYVFFALSHIVIGADGRIGIYRRAGRDDESPTCGALAAFQKELSAGQVAVDKDGTDVEQSLLKARLQRELRAGSAPDLLKLTRLAQRASQRDLEQALSSVVDVSKSDYALATGIQIHGPKKNYVHLVSFYAVVNGTRHELGA